MFERLMWLVLSSIYLTCLKSAETFWASLLLFYPFYSLFVYYCYHYCMIYRLSMNAAMGILPRPLRWHAASTPNRTFRRLRCVRALPGLIPCCGRSLHTCRSTSHKTSTHSSPGKRHERTSSTRGCVRMLDPPIAVRLMGTGPKRCCFLCLLFRIIQGLVFFPKQLPHWWAKSPLTINNLIK